MIELLSMETAMTWQIPNSSDDSWSPLPPPARFDPADFNQPPPFPPLSTLPPPPPPPRRGRHRLTLAACVAGLVIGISGAAAVSHYESVGSSSRRAVAAFASPAPKSSQSDLTVGLVNVNTVLGYQQAEGSGSGIVLTANGEILTNNHVIDGATKISVTVVATGKSYSASVVGTDRTDDIAVLRLESVSGLTTARLGDSSTVRVGDPVVGVGNAGGLGTPTSSPGSVTQLGQTITATNDTGANAETLHDLIEISARLQPGQSGGPLYDAAGKVVGLDAAGSGGGGRFRLRTASTAGYAIPINDALAVAKQIESGKASSTITIGTPPMLGIGAIDATGPVAGARITDVAAGTPAAKIGLHPGDVIVAVGSTKVTSVNDLTAALQAHKAGDKVTITWTTSAGATHSATATTIAGPAN
jgi:S1-C subfamily serine protease